MSMRTVITKYEPMDGNTYVGNSGEMWIDLETNLLHVGDDVTPGGSTPVITQGNGVNNMGGNLWVGTVADNDSVMWAGEDCEYAALWWGGNRDIANEGYGPSASLSVGPSSPDDMVDRPEGVVPNIHLNVSTNKHWYFDGYTGNFVMDSVEGQILARQSDAISTGGYSFMNDGGTDTGMFSTGDGVIQFNSNAKYALTCASMSTPNTADWTVHGSMTLNVLTAAPAGVAGKMAVCDGTSWNGGGDGLQHLMIYINGSWTKVV